MRVGALGAVALGLALAAPAVAQHHGGGHDGAAREPVAVAAAFDAFEAPHVDVLAGETVRWTNVSVRPHTVTAADGSWDSGRIPLEGSFSHTFDRAGAVPYLCTLHPAMRGEVAVHDALLDAPTEHAAPGRAFPLQGRSALPVGAPVTIEADAGAGFERVGVASVTSDGTFGTTVTPVASTRYRVVAGAGPSPAVQLLVVDRELTITRRRDVVTAVVAPPAPGMTVVLQLRLRERFGWWPVRRMRLDAASRARFVLGRGRSRVSARVLLTLRDGATELARSRTVHVG